MPYLVLSELGSLLTGIRGDIPSSLHVVSSCPVVMVAQLPRSLIMNAYMQLCLLLDLASNLQLNHSTIYSLEELLAGSASAL